MLVFHLAYVPVHTFSAPRPRARRARAARVSGDQSGDTGMPARLQLLESEKSSGEPCKFSCHINIKFAQSRRHKTKAHMTHNRAWWMVHMCTTERERERERRC